MEHISIDKIPILITYVLKDDWFRIKDNIDKELFSGRFSGYSVISDYIEELGDDQRDILQSNAYKHREKCLKIENGSESLDNIEKLLEHILLEIPRASQNSKMKTQVSTISMMNRKIREESKKFKEEISKHEIKMEKMQGEFISILSIFSAIIIAFFGGINLLGSALTNIEKCSKYRLITIVLIVGLIMFNIIYMLLYTISRLIKRNIGSRRKERLCKKCNENLGLKCLLIRYPLICCYNFIIIALLLLTIMLYVIDQYNLITYVVSKCPIISKTKETVGAIGVIITISFFIIIIKSHDNIMNLFNCSKNVCNLSGKEKEEEEEEEEKETEKYNKEEYEAKFGVFDYVAEDSINAKNIEQKIDKNKKH